MENRVENNFRANSRRKRVGINTIISIISEFILVLIGIFMPKAVIKSYGSETNGIVNSIQQVITYLTLFETGLYGATLISLYKPMSEKNMDKLDEICTSVSKTYKKISLLYLCGAILIATIYPLIAKQQNYTYFEILIFVLLISFPNILQAFCGSQYKIALMASQKNWIVSIIRCVSISLYYGLIIILSTIGINPILTYAIANFAYILRALLFYLAAKKFLPEIKFNKKNTSKIKFPKTKSVLLQQICSTITLNSSMIILVIFANMDLVSVFVVYNAILSGVFLVIDTINQNILTSFGNLAVEKKERVSFVYREYTCLFTILLTIIVSCLGSLIMSFISLYVSDITDINYVNTLYVIPTILLCLLWPIRNQQTIVLSAEGKYEQMNLGAVIETASVVVFSILGFIFFGLSGLLFGKALGVLVRVIDITILNNKRKNQNSLFFTIKQYLLCFVPSCLVILISFINENKIISVASNWISWFLTAIILFIVSMFFLLLIRLIFDKYSRDIIKKYIAKVLCKIKGANILSSENYDSKIDTIHFNNLECLNFNGKNIRIENFSISNGINPIKNDQIKFLNFQYKHILSGNIEIIFKNGKSKIYKEKEINTFSFVVNRNKKRKTSYIYIKSDYSKDMKFNPIYTIIQTTPSNDIERIKNNIIIIELEAWNAYMNRNYLEIEI